MGCWIVILINNALIKHNIVGFIGLSNVLNVCLHKDLIKNVTATDDDDIDRPRSTRRGGPNKHSIFKNDKISAITQIFMK